MVKSNLSFGHKFTDLDYTWRQNLFDVLVCMYLKKKKKSHTSFIHVWFNVLSPLVMFCQGQIKTLGDKERGKYIKSKIKMNASVWKINSLNKDKWSEKEHLLLASLVAFKQKDVNMVEWKKWTSYSKVFICFVVKSLMNLRVNKLTTF